MSLLLLLAAHVVASQKTVTPKFIELSDPGLSEVTVEAIVKLPALDNHERAMLDRLARSIPMGPAEYSQNDLMAITGGRVVRCDIMPDCLVIEIPAFKEDLVGAISVLAGVLRNARIDDSSTLTSGNEPDPWTSVIHGPLAPQDGYKLRKGELAEFYHRVFRPESVTVAVSGPFASDEAQKEWDRKIDGWQLPNLIRAWPLPDPLPDSSPSIGAIELDGPEISPDSPNLNSSLLALFALGCGKGGSLYRIAREKDGLSYRQEAVLWPTTTGWVPRLVVAASDQKDPDGAAAQLKIDLIADVSKWTEADRLRASGLATGVLERGVPLSPFYFQSDGPVTGSVYNRAFLEAYWLSKTGTPWNAEGMAERLRGVSLEALKAAAYEMLTHAQLLVKRPK